MCSADKFGYCDFDGNCPLRGYDWKLLNEDHSLHSNDMTFAMNKMNEKGDWEKFVYHIQVNKDEERCNDLQKENVFLEDFIFWLMQPSRFFELMSEALEKGVIEK